MTEQEIRDGAPRGSNKYILFKDESVLYLRVNIFIEYWNQEKWNTVAGFYAIKFDLDMVGIYPI